MNLAQIEGAARVADQKDLIMQISSSGVSGMTSLASVLSLSQTGSTTAATSYQSTTSEAAASKENRPPPPPPPPSGTSGTDSESLFSALVENDDADSDGAISLTEAENSPVADVLSKMFETIDTNGDGLMTEAEMGEFESSMLSAASGEAGAMSDRGDAEGKGDRPPPPPPSENDSYSVTSAQESLVQALASFSDTEGSSLDALLIKNAQSAFAQAA